MTGEEDRVQIKTKKGVIELSGFAGYLHLILWLSFFEVQDEFDLFAGDEVLFRFTAQSIEVG